jgi:hypothetical protein
MCPPKFPVWLSFVIAAVALAVLSTCASQPVKKFMEPCTPAHYQRGGVACQPK